MHGTEKHNMQKKKKYMENEPWSARIFSKILIRVVFSQMLFTAGIEMHMGVG